MNHDLELSINKYVITNNINHNYNLNVLWKKLNNQINWYN